MRDSLTFAARCSRFRPGGYLRHGFSSIFRQDAAQSSRTRRTPFTTNSEIVFKHLEPLGKSIAGSQNRDYPHSTIYALSTASGKAGVAVVRISGPACIDIYRALCPDKALPKARYAAVRTLHHPTINNNILDSEALVLYFNAPRTVTGEDVLEFHVHGGAATVKAVLAAIPQSESAYSIRYAEAGEFTRRAFQNDRLDLAQVEALSDTLSAETELQRRAAVRGNSGKLGRTYEKWRHQLLYARGEVEAFIDFYEDQDFDTDEAEMLKSIEDQIRDIQQSIALHVVASRRGELLRKGIRISMLGPPNAGKSSLLNQIVGREASIVSSEAGTTRDIVEVSLDIEGYLCTFADTAGLRISSVAGNDAQGSAKTIGEVEAEGIRRAKAKARGSDMVIVFASVELVDSTWRILYDPQSLDIASEVGECVVVVNKVDRVPSDVFEPLFGDFKERISSNLPGTPTDRIFTISCKEARAASSRNQANVGNIKSLVDGLVSAFRSMTTLEQEDLYGVTERQNQLLKQCSSALNDYLSESSSGDSDEIDIVLAAEYLRTAADCLSRITGRGEAGDVEEVLGVVFEKFCVGK